MMTLRSPNQAEPLVAQLLEREGQCEVSVSEERAFECQWLQLGRIALVSNDLGSASPTRLIQHGAFEWDLPKLGSCRAATSSLLGLEDNSDNSSVSRVMDHVASIATRIGCIHPRFDATALEQMPFRRSTTIVLDTSGILQGALDFVVRHLHPAARVKIPAIAQMEIANQADRFFGMRRSSKNPTPNRRLKELLEHLASQGGQRALLRVELHTDTEVERTYLLGDPLRSAFQQESDQDLKELNISSPIRSYADRLILESARHHQAQSEPAHAVLLLTGDQGLARMAIAEGVRPLYFTSASAEQVFGRRLSGQVFDPFSGHVRQIPLMSLIWELATSFGSARLTSNEKTFRVTAIGEQLSWAPYHAEEDLLWCMDSLPTPLGTAAKSEKIAPDAETAAKARRTAAFNSPARPPQKSMVFLRFDVDRLFRLVCALDDQAELPITQVETIVRGRADEYRRFLDSGDLAVPATTGWTAKDRLSILAAALRNERIDEIRRVLLDVPSFAAFAERLDALSPGQALESSELGRGSRTYRVLGEIALMCATLPRNRLFPTPNRPEPSEFALVALKRFAALDGERGGLVPSGEWLEALIEHDRIHPEVAQSLLDTTSGMGLLRRSTEGSTTQLRFNDRVVHVLRTRDGEPYVQRIFLYRGDYLIPGKASVSLRIEDPTA